LGPAASFAGRRYAAGLPGLFGPAAAFGGFGLAFGHPSAALGRSSGRFCLGSLLWRLGLPF